MKTSSKISNLRRELVNTYSIPEHMQFEFIAIYNEVVRMEGTPKKQLCTCDANDLQPFGGCICQVKA